MDCLSIVVPWREEGTRLPLFKWVTDRLTLQFPDAELLICDSGDQQFSRSRSRNLGASQSTRDFILFVDADTFTEKEFIEEGVRLLQHGAPWVLPYGDVEYFNLNEEFTEEVLQLSCDTSIAKPSKGQYDFRLMSWAGLVMVTKEMTERLKYDEGFNGWGHEDVAYRLKLDHERGPHQRVGLGYAMHLFHQRNNAGFNDMDELANRRRFQTYVDMYQWRDERVAAS